CRLPPAGTVRRRRRCTYPARGGVRPGIVVSSACAHSSPATPARGHDEAIRGRACPRWEASRAVTNQQYDLVVVGGGLAGLTAGMFGGRYGLRTAVIDFMGSGGQVLNVEHIENFPGFPEGI